MFDVEYDICPKAMIEAIREELQSINEKCSILENSIRVWRERYKWHNELCVHLDALMQYGIGDAVQRESASNLLLAINGECSFLENRIKDLRVRETELGRLAVMLDIATHVGRMVPGGFELIDKYFGPDKYFGSEWVSKRIVE